jgi:hypothetical protein
MDVLFARNISLRAVLISSQRGLEELQNAGVSVDYCAANLEDAANWIINQ